MNYINLEEIKKQCNIENDFTEDDALLNIIGEAAEQWVEAQCNQALDELTADSNGILPVPVKLAMLLFCSFMYDHRGTDDPPLPPALFALLQLYKKYSIA